MDAMRYLATLYDRENPSALPGSPGWDAVMPGYARFAQLAASAIVDGDALHASTTGFTVRAPEDGSDAPLVTDGPFAETSEVIGGYYVLEAETLDDVIALAREIPVAAHPHGAVEVRPTVMVWAPDEPVVKQDGDTRYLAMIYGKETAADVPDTPEWDEAAALHGQFGQKHAGALMSGVALHPASTATTVRVRDGELVVSDGPFAETAEVIGGLYVLRAASPADAVAVAQDTPTNPGGAVELRPIVEFG
jgi:hypothetical protein